jgi:hypothetical protein
VQFTGCPYPEKAYTMTQVELIIIYSKMATAADTLFHNEALHNLKSPSNINGVHEKTILYMQYTVGMEEHEICIQNLNVSEKNSREKINIFLLSCPNCFFFLILLLEIKW